MKRIKKKGKPISLILKYLRQKREEEDWLGKHTDLKKRSLNLEGKPISKEDLEKLERQFKVKKR